MGQAVCGSVFVGVCLLECVAVCCSVGVGAQHARQCALQSVDCSVLKCSVLQRVSSVLQCDAM